MGDWKFGWKFGWVSHKLLGVPQIACKLLDFDGCPAICTQFRNLGWVFHNFGNVAHHHDCHPDRAQRRGICFCVLIRGNDGHGNHGEIMGVPKFTKNLPKFWCPKIKFAWLEIWMGVPQFRWVSQFRISMGVPQFAYRAQRRGICFCVPIRGYDEHGIHGCPKS